VNFGTRTLATLGYRAVALRLVRRRVPSRRAQQVAQRREKRDEAVEIEERQEIDLLRSQALAADRDRFEKHHAEHGHDDADGLALAVEVPREEGGQRYEGEGEGVPRARQTLVRLDEKARGVEPVVRIVHVGMQEIAEEAL